jgi:hypothetical protein
VSSGERVAQNRTEHLPWVFVNLTEFGLVFGNGNTCTIEDNEACAGCTLIDGTDETLLEVVGTSVFILQQGAVPVVCLMRSDLNVKFVARGIVVVEFKIVGRLRVAINTAIQFKWVAHFRVWWKGGGNIGVEEGFTGKG